MGDSWRKRGFYWFLRSEVANVAIILFFQGGIKAVIWTDVFQCGVMLAGMFAILIKVYIYKINSNWMFKFSYKFYLAQNLQFCLNTS